ncbi:MAG: anti-sigma factor, partial [Pedobacter sp.]
MIDRSQFNSEDFLVDSTFQQYCAGTDKLCVGYWEKYIKAHPEQADVVAEAKKLFFILSGNKQPLNNQIGNFKQNFSLTPETPKAQNTYLWFKIAAAILIIGLIGIIYQSYYNKGANEPITVAQVFKTKAGERKRITLPDGTTVLLNAKSSLSVGKDFNGKLREVILTGEAFFDVEHNKEKPFQVHTADFNINVLGTSFNVKAYPDETTSEATLINGLITMEAVDGNGGTITLKPSQKVTFYKNLPKVQAKKVLKPASTRPEITINHYTLIKDSTIVETAWTKNRIEIYDQDFDEIKGVLEKWF